MVENKVS